MSLVYDSARAHPTRLVRFAFDVVPEFFANESPAQVRARVMTASLSVDYAGRHVKTAGTRMDDANVPSDLHVWSVENLLNSGDARRIGGGIAVRASNLPTGVLAYELSTGFGLLRDAGVNGAMNPHQGAFANVNSIDSAFGHGWGIAGLQEIVESEISSGEYSGSLLLTDGNGEELVFVRRDTPQGSIYESPPGDFSVMQREPDGTFRRSLPNGTVYDFDTKNRLEVVTDRNGNRTEYRYASDGLLTAIVDPVGLETTFEYTAGHLSAIEYAGGRRTQVTVDSTGVLESIIGADRAERRFAYDARHLMTSETDPRNFTRKFNYDRYGRFVAVAHPDGALVRFSAASETGGMSEGILTSAVAVDGSASLASNLASSRGDVTTFTLDSGHITEQRDAIALTEYVRDQNSLVVASQDGRRNRTFYDFNDVGLITKIESQHLLKPGALGSHTENSITSTISELPIGGVIGDVNGDSIQDIVRRGSSRLEVAVGNGDGTFQRPIQHSFDVNVGLSTVAHDFNRDGILDIVYYQPDESTISTLLGNGSGGFYESGKTAIAELARPVAAYDFNGDGGLDIVSIGSNTLSVFLGNSDGTFSRERLLSIGNRPRLVRGGDLNTDGTLDLIITTDSPGIVILEGDGAGNFEMTHRLALQDDASDLEVADLDGDGAPEIIVAVADPGALVVYRGDGSDDDMTQTVTPLVTSLTEIEMRDMNHDGFVDLIGSSGTYTGDVLVAIGHGDGTFDLENSARYHFHDFIRGSIDLAVSDLNGDETLDVVASISGLSRIFLGNGDGSLRTIDGNTPDRTENRYTGPRNPSELVTGDFNGDNIKDVVAGGPDIYFYEGSASRLKAPRFVIDANTSGRGNAPMGAADLNEDGIDDVVFLSGSELTVLFGATEDSLSDRRVLATNLPQGGAPLAAGDVDGNGHIDVVIPVSSGVYIAFNNGDETFELADFASGSPIGIRPISLGNISNDSVLDIVYINSEGDVEALIVDSDRTITPIVLPVTNAAGNGSRLGRPGGPLAIADVDGDGRSDIVAEGSSSVEVALRRDDGTFEITVTRLSGTTGHKRVLLVNDVDEDGKIDIITTTEGGLGIFLGDGSGHFITPNVLSRVGRNEMPFSIEDFNNDGRPDLLLSHHEYFGILYADAFGGFGVDLVPVFSQPNNRAIDYGFTAGDLNNDGQSDVVVGAKNGDTWTIATSLGMGLAGLSASVHTQVNGQLSAIALGHIDGDELLDVVVKTVTRDDRGTAISDELYLFRGRGDGSLEPGEFIADVPSPGFRSSPSLAIKDIDHDGNADIAVTGNSDSNYFVLWGYGDGTFDEGNVSSSRNGRTMLVTDLNDDELLDFVTFRDEAVHITYANSSDTREFEAVVSVDMGVHAWLGAVGDFNSDGLVDLYSGGDRNGGALRFRNADGTFSPPVTAPGFDDLSGRGQVRAMDINVDGHLDLIGIGGPASGISAVLGNGDGSFEDPIRLDLSSQPFAIANINGDRVPDLFILDGDNTRRFIREVPLFTFVAKTRATTEERFAYDFSFGQLTEYSDGLGNISTYDIDPRNGNTLVIHRPGNSSTTFAYKASGQVSSVTDELGRVTEYEYDDFGRTTRITFAKGTNDEGTQRFEYDDAGNQILFVDEEGNPTEFEYDELNRLTLTRDAERNETKFIYDRAGNLKETIDARDNRTVNEYDSRNRLVRSTDANSQDTIFEYDTGGNLKAVTDPLGNETRKFYDARNRLVETIDPEGGVTRFRYDPDDNLVSLTDPEENETVFFYDARNRLIREIDPLGVATTYDYDGTDNLVRKVDRNRRVTVYEYDPLNRLVAEYWFSGEEDDTEDNTISYDYDDAGNLLVTKDDNDSTLTFSYDERNRVKTVSNTGTIGAPEVVIEYTYDRVGNVLSVTDDANGGTTTGYTYDALSRLMTLTQAGARTSEKLVDFVYNELGQFSTIDRYSDLRRTHLVARSKYDYDHLNRLIDLQHGTDADVRAFAYYEYEFDDSSRITKITDIDGVTDYSYDDRSQLTGADRAEGDVRGDESYDYDANGNRVASHLHGAAYETGAGNRLEFDGTYRYRYDAEGNMIRRTVEVENGDSGPVGTYRGFEWDHRNRLVSVTDSSPKDVITQAVTYRYDTLDRRIAKKH